MVGVLCDPLLLARPSSAPVLQQGGAGSREVWGETIEIWVEEVSCVSYKIHLSPKGRVSVQASVSQNQGGKM